MIVSYFLCLSINFIIALVQSSVPQKTPIVDSNDRDRQVAGRFAPIFYQALGEKPHSDYITNFDFDGDWRGDNNWENADNQQFTLKAFIYYSVAETNTNFFIHYAVFHPRDYKGGEERGKLLSELIREGFKRGGKYDPTGRGDEAILAHENDMEGCLVVVKKNGSDLSKGRVTFVESLHHNKFSRYATTDTSGFSTVRLEDGHPSLYVEPKGHGIEGFLCDEKQCGGKDFVRYKFTGTPGSPREPRSCPNAGSGCGETVGYDLIPIATSLWSRALNAPNETYGDACNYGVVKLPVTTVKSSGEVEFDLSRMGCAFLGKVGGANMAKPPWAWLDFDRRNRKLGSWFFDPAAVVKEDFGLSASFSTVYKRTPFWAIPSTSRPKGPE